MAYNDKQRGKQQEKGNSGNFMIAYVITKREVGGEEKSFWNRIGVAFRNKDGSYNIRLDALPVSGELHIREPKEDE